MDLGSARSVGKNQTLPRIPPQTNELAQSMPQSPIHRPHPLERLCKRDGARTSIKDSLKTSLNTLNSNASTAITTEQTDGLPTPKHIETSLAPDFECGEVTIVNLNIAKLKRREIKSVGRNLKKEVDEEVKCTLKMRKRQDYQNRELPRLSHFMINNF